MMFTDQLQLQECDFELQLIDAETSLFESKRNLRRLELDGGDRLAKLSLKVEVNRAEVKVVKIETVLFHLRRKIKAAVNSQ